jgi:hypothetical protein
VIDPLLAVLLARNFHSSRASAPVAEGKKEKDKSMHNLREIFIPRASRAAR